MNGCGNGKVFKVTHYTAFSLFVNSFVDISAQLMSATHPASVRQSGAFLFSVTTQGHWVKPGWPGLTEALSVF